MLKLGEKNVAALRRGDAEIVRACLGDKVVFNSSPSYTISLSVDPQGSGTVTGAGQYREGAQATVKANPEGGYEFVAWKEPGESRLPNRYTELEYIQSSGAQYINTGFNPTTKTKLVLDLKIIDTSGTFVLFGAKEDTTTREKQYFVMAMGSTSRFEANYFSRTEANLVNLSDYKDRGTLSLDGSAISFNSSSAPLNYTAGDNEIPYPIYLFGYNLSGTFSSAAKIFLYSCQIYESGTLVRNFVPCIDPSGIIGLYDLVGGAFYANAGTGAFAAGPEVNTTVVSENAEYAFTVTGNRSLTAVFEKKPSRLPEGYTELKYISNPNGAYIYNFGVGATDIHSKRFEFKVKLLDESKTQYFFGGMYSYFYVSGSINKQYSNYSVLGFYVSGTSKTIGCNYGYTQINSSGGGTGVSIEYDDSEMNIVVDTPKGTVSVNGTTVKISTGRPTTNARTPSLFASSYYYYRKSGSNDAISSTSEGVKPANIEFYHLKIYTSTADKTGDLIHHYVPAKNSSGMVGIFDLVTKTFYRNSGTNVFEAGPAV